MKTVLFTYATPLGSFWMIPEPADRVQLGLDRHKLGTYSSAKAAARAVAEHATGYGPWDSDQSMAAPASLDKWKRPANERGKPKNKKVNE